MDKKLLLQDSGNIQEVKEISILDDSQKLKMILGGLSWRIITLLSKKEMYPLEIAKQLGMHEQKVYYHIRKLAKAGAITVVREEKKKGATAKYYKAVSPAFGIELPSGYKQIQNLCTFRRKPLPFWENSRPKAWWRSSARSRQGKRKRSLHYWISSRSR